MSEQTQSTIKVRKMEPDLGLQEVDLTLQYPAIAAQHERGRRAAYDGVMREARGQLLQSHDVRTYLRERARIREFDDQLAELGRQAAMLAVSREAALANKSLSPFAAAQELDELGKQQADLAGKQASLERMKAELVSRVAGLRDRLPAIIENAIRVAGRVVINGIEAKIEHAKAVLVNESALGQLVAAGVALDEFGGNTIQVLAPRDLMAELDQPDSKIVQRMLSPKPVPAAPVEEPVAAGV